MNLLLDTIVLLMVTIPFGFSSTKIPRIVVLDRGKDLNSNWSITNCTYGEIYRDFIQPQCKVRMDSVKHDLDQLKEQSRKRGFWTPCYFQKCQMSYPLEFSALMKKARVVVTGLLSGHGGIQLFLQSGIMGVDDIFLGGLNVVGQWSHESFVISTPISVPPNMAPPNSSLVLVIALSQPSYPNDLALLDRVTIEYMSHSDNVHQPSIFQFLPKIRSNSYAEPIIKSDSVNMKGTTTIGPIPYEHLTKTSTALAGKVKLDGAAESQSINQLAMEAQTGRPLLGVAMSVLQATEINVLAENGEAQTVSPTTASDVVLRSVSPDLQTTFETQAGITISTESDVAGSPAPRKAKCIGPTPLSQTAFPTQMPEAEQNSMQTIIGWVTTIQLDTSTMASVSKNSEMPRTPHLQLDSVTQSTGVNEGQPTAANTEELDLMASSPKTELTKSPLQTEGMPFVSEVITSSTLADSQASSRVTEPTPLPDTRPLTPVSYAGHVNKPPATPPPSAPGVTLSEPELQIQSEARPTMSPEVVTGSKTELDINTATTEPKLDRESGVPEPKPDTSQGSPEPEPETSQGSPKPEPETSQGFPEPEPETSQGSPEPEPDTSQVSPEPEPETSQASPEPEPDTSQASPEASHEMKPVAPEPEPDTSQVSPEPHPMKPATPEPEIGNEQAVPELEPGKSQPAPESDKGNGQGAPEPQPESEKEASRLAEPASTSQPPNTESSPAEAEAAHIPKPENTEPEPEVSQTTSAPNTHKESAEPEPNPSPAPSAPMPEGLVTTSSPRTELPPSPEAEPSDPEPASEPPPEKSDTKTAGPAPEPEFEPQHSTPSMPKKTPDTAESEPNPKTSTENTNSNLITSYPISNITDTPISKAEKQGAESESLAAESRMMKDSSAPWGLYVGIPIGAILFVTILSVGYYMKKKRARQSVTP